MHGQEVCKVMSYSIALHSHRARSARVCVAACHGLPREVHTVLAVLVVRGARSHYVVCLIAKCYA